MTPDERRVLQDASKSIGEYSQALQYYGFEQLKLIQLQLATATVIIDRDLLALQKQTNLMKRGI